MCTARFVAPGGMKGSVRFSGSLSLSSSMLCKTLFIGFRDISVEEDSTVVICVAQVFRNVQAKYKFENSASEPLMIEDLRTLRNSVNERSFKMGCKLFVKKWSKKEEEVMKLVQNLGSKKTVFGIIAKNQQRKRIIQRSYEETSNAVQKNLLKQFFLMAINNRTNKLLFQKSVPKMMQSGKNNKNCNRNY